MNYPVSFEIPVAWGEMDAFGHVNNVVFFRYFESTRIAYFRQLLGEKVKSEELTPILAQTECQYLRPVYFPDTLIAETGVSHIGRTSFTMLHRLTSKEQKAVVAEGKAVIVNIEAESGKSRPLSDHIKERMSALQA